MRAAATTAPAGAAGADPSSPTPFVLIGHQRGGTSFVNTLCKAHPEVECINEPFSMHVGLFRDNEAEEWTPGDIDAGRLHPSLDAASGESRFIEDLRDWMWAPLAGLQRGFKETHLLLKLEWLTAALGVVRGAGLARDPRAVVASVVTRDMHRSWWDHHGLVRAYRERGLFVEAGLVDPDPDDPIQVVGALWALRMRRVVEWTRAHDLPVVRLEDLVLRPEEGLDVLMSSGLGTAPSWEQLALLRSSHEVGGSHTYSYLRDPDEVLRGWRRALSPDDVASVLEVAGPVAEELSYV